jgi:hypothetical protein
MTKTLEQYARASIMKLFDLEPGIEDASIVFKLRLLKDRLVERFDQVRQLKKYKEINKPYTVHYNSMALCTGLASIVADI